MRMVYPLMTLALLLSACDGPQASQQTSSTPIPGVRIGGPFQLVDTENRPVSDKSLLGKPTAIFFGFTFCPEVCPTTLTEMTAALASIGPNADKLNVVFVSVDPERDTPAQMKTYLSSFDPHIQGFTGTVEQVDAAAKAYRVYHQKVPLEGGGFTIDHSSSVYLFDRKGEFVAPVAYGTAPDVLARKLRGLLAPG
jgi:protein SCO1/2